MYGCCHQHSMSSTAVELAKAQLGGWFFCFRGHQSLMPGTWLVQAHPEDSTPVSIWNSCTLAELCTQLGVWHFVMWNGIPRRIMAVLWWLVIWSEKSQAVIPIVLVGQSDTRLGLRPTPHGRVAHSHSRGRPGWLRSHTRSLEQQWRTDSVSQAARSSSAFFVTQSLLESQWENGATANYSLNSDNAGMDRILCGKNDSPFWINLR